MKLFPEGKSRLLSGVSLAAAAVCAAMLAKSARDLLTLLDVISTPAFYLSLVNATVPVDMPPLGAVMVRHMRAFFFFMAFFWLAGLVLSLGVWARREWGRQGACWLLYLLAGGLLLTLAYPWLVVPRPLMYGGVSLAPEFNGAVRAAAFLVRAASFVLGGLCLWGALALDRGEARGEFLPSGFNKI